MYDLLIHNGVMSYAKILHNVIYPSCVQDDERNRQIKSDDRLENLIEVSQDPCGAPTQPQLPPIPQQPQSFSRSSYILTK